MVEPTVALYGATYQKTTDILDELLQESGARYVMLVDRKGFVLAHREAIWAPQPPSLDSLATLIAGNAAAIQALAKLLGENAFSELVHQGDEYGIYIEEAGPQALLVVIFDKSAPVGRVKLFGKRASQGLTGVMKEALVDPNKLGIDDEYSAGATALLDDLFGN